MLKIQGEFLTFRCRNPLLDVCHTPWRLVVVETNLIRHCQFWLLKALGGFSGRVHVHIKKETGGLLFTIVRAVFPMVLVYLLMVPTPRPIRSRERHPVLVAKGCRFCTGDQEWVRSALADRRNVTAKLSAVWFP